VLGFRCLSSLFRLFLSSFLSLVFSLFGFFLLPFLSLFFFFSSVFFPLFIEPRGGAFYGCTWGARAAAVGRPFVCSCRGSAPCFSGRRAAGGRPAGVAGEVRLPRFSGKACGQERGSTLEEEKPTIFLSSPAACPGEEERGTMSFKTTPFRSSLFFYMKRRRFRKNAPFHLSPAKRQNASICKAALNYLFFFFNCIPANFGLCPSCWPHVSL